MQERIGSSVALVAVFAALIAVVSLVPGFQIGPVPFALQLIVVLLSPLVLGPWQGMLAVLLYVVAGVAGLPVFAGQKSGIGVILGPTGGYLVGYIGSALLVGLLASLTLRSRSLGAKSLVGLTFAAVAGVVVIHIFGVAGLMRVGLTLDKALATTAGFVLLDLVKALLAAFVAVALFKAFPRLLALRG